METKYTQQQETEIVRDAMKLMVAIKNEEEELIHLRNERFRPCPPPPKEKLLSGPDKITVDYPPKPQTSYSFNDYFYKSAFKDQKLKIIIGVAIIVFLIVISIILGVNESLFSTTMAALTVMVAIGMIIAFLVSCSVKYRRRRNAMNAELEKDEDYQKARKAAENFAAAKQLEADRAYENAKAKAKTEFDHAMTVYNTQTVPAYEKAYADWRDLQDKKIRALDVDLKENTELLNCLYNTTRIISSTYRTIPILAWLYEDMSTSDHDIRYATELLDRNRQLVATMNVNQSINNMHADMQTGFRAVYESIEEGNALQEETNEILDKMMLDMKLGNIVMTLQNGKIIRILKKRQ